MILFMNVKVTSKGISVYDRGMLKNYQRYQIFCYTLSSLSVIPWSKVFLYIEVDETQVQFKDAVFNHARRLFPDAVIEPRQLAYQKEWQKVVEDIEAINDELVLYSGNDDHVFIDSTLDAILGLESKMLQSLDNSHHVIGSCTHLPEVISDVVNRPSFTLDDGFLVGRLPKGRDKTGLNFISMLLVSKAVLRSWWFSTDYGDSEIRRTDGTPASNCFVQCDFESVCVVSLREIIRHFDAYSHNKVDIANCPPLTIPEGFFENNIILQYGGTPKSGVTLVDSLNPDNSAVAEDGADWQTTLDEIPLFWRDAVAETKILREATKEDLVAAMAVRVEAIVSGSHLKALGTELDSMHRIYDCISHAGGKMRMSPIELATIQDRLFYNWSHKLMMNRSLHVNLMTENRHKVRLSVVIDDPGGKIASEMESFDLSSLHMAGVNVVWLITPYDGCDLSVNGANIAKTFQLGSVVATLFHDSTYICDSFETVNAHPSVRHSQPSIGKFDYFLESSVKLAAGGIVLWLDTSPSAIKNILVMLSKRMILEQLAESLCSEKNDIVRLVSMTNIDSLPFEGLIGTAALRCTARQLLADLSKTHEQCSDKTARRLAILPNIKSSRLDISLPSITDTHNFTQTQRIANKWLLDSDEIMSLLKQSYDWCYHSRINIGYKYYKGTGVRQDYLLAYMWTKLVCNDFSTYNDSSIFASRVTETQFSNVQNIVDHNLATIVSKMSKTQLSQAQCLVSEFFVKTKENVWLFNAAMRGSPIHQQCLGNMYAKNIGVARNFVTAYMWTCLALERRSCSYVWPSLTSDQISNGNQLLSFLGNVMTKDQIGEAQYLVGKWECIEYGSDRVHKYQKWVSANKT